MPGMPLALLILGGMALMASCQKEETDTLPEGAIMLTMEGYHADGSKTQVNGNSVAWVGGESVRINGNSYAVTVSDGKAYINGDGIASGALYGYYGASVTNGENTLAPTVTVPSEYSCTYDGNSTSTQIIALPMVAYSPSKGNSIKFRHVTSAIQVKLRKSMYPSYVRLDRVVISSSTHQLSGTVPVTLDADGNPTVAAQTTNTRNSVTVNVTDTPSIFTSDGIDGLYRTVQVPVLPISDGSITIEVFAHEDGYPECVYKYKRENISVSSLPRNAMASAGCIFQESEYTNIIDVSRHSSDEVRVTNGNIITGRLTGTSSTTAKFTVVEGATVTLCNAYINHQSSNTSACAGINCSGTCTLVLKGTNSVTGSSYYPGIYIASGSTLTIRGGGSLDATGTNNGAGIGGGANVDCGNINIESGTITASCGSSQSAGIGAGMNTTCGYITISGGTVTASGGGNNGAGIGAGSEQSGGTSQCGNITITGGTVTARGGSGGAGIGSAHAYSSNGNSICGDILISGGTVTAQGGSVRSAGIGTGLGEGNGTSQCGSITITDRVTSVTATRGGYNGNYAYSIIGKAANTGNCVCGAVTIGGATGFITTGNSGTNTYIYPAPQSK